MRIEKVDDLACASSSFQSPSSLSVIVLLFEMLRFVWVSISAAVLSRSVRRRNSLQAAGIDVKIADLTTLNYTYLEVNVIKEKGFEINLLTIPIISFYFVGTVDSLCIAADYRRPLQTSAVCTLPTAHCLTITQNVAFEFLNCGIFHQFLSY